MLGAQLLSLYGRDTQHAFGHLGFTNMLAWADPERAISVAVLNNGKPIDLPGGLRVSRAHAADHERDAEGARIRAFALADRTRRQRLRASSSKRS